MNSSFLPEGYEPPVPVNHYMKFEEGENKIRVLSSAIVGWEYWQDAKEGRKPVRVKTFEELPKVIKTLTVGKDRPRHFWAFVIWNYDLEQVQILELTQKSVQRGIEALIKNKDWGTPKEYDLIITRKKTGSEMRDVEYSVMPSPKKAISGKITEEYESMKIDLDKLYEGESPFETGEQAEITMEDLEETGMVSKKEKLRQRIEKAKNYPK